MAIKMHFKQGSIVRFSLTCSTDFNSCGRVIEVNNDEIVFVPQKYVSETEYTEGFGTNQLNRQVSVDIFPEIHIDRSLVAMWKYEPVPLSKRTTYFDVLQPSQISNMVVNQYDEDGFCKGQGDYFE